MKIKPFMSITGVVLVLNDDNGMEFGQLRLPKDCLSDVAVACTESSTWMLHRN